MRSPGGFGWLILILTALAGSGCDSDPVERARSETEAVIGRGSEEPAIDDSQYPATARPDTHRELLTARSLDHAPGDGGGSARLVEGEPVLAGTIGRWVIEFTTGPHGIEEGGALVFQVSPFWGWSTPHTHDPNRPGYTELACSRDDIDLLPTIGNQMLIVQIDGGRLEEGDQITVTYGAGVGAVADRFAEELEFFYLWVDADGDGTRRLLDKDVPIRILPHPTSQLIVTIPTTRHPGEEALVRVAAVDPLGNRTADFAGKVELAAADGLELSTLVLEFQESDRGVRTFPATVKETGVFIVQASWNESVFESNPMVAAPAIPRVYWGDLHGHSTWSDGTGTPEDYYEYGRDVAGLDICVLTDHDHYGLHKLDAEPELWKELCDVAESFHEPGKFVTLLGYEWTSWLYGHRHVLYFDSVGEVFSCLDEATDTPTELWDRLRTANARTLAHHSASGAVVATDWSYAPPPDIEPVVEIVSVHGNSEGRGAPLSVRGGVNGSFVRDALGRGYQLGFVGSGDGHDGHPGLTHLASPTGGGLAAFRASDLTREGIRDALDQRWVYATNGARIFVGFRLEDTPMGSVHPATAIESAKGRTFHVFVVEPTSSSTSI